MHTRAYWSVLAIFAGIVALWSSSFARAGQAAPPDRSPVIVELFTSEGCSSCPAADQLLMHLSQQQPVTNADIIILSEHVDYWNTLGWTDPFSSALFTRRQQDYARSMGTADVYTPQMVVDGATQFIGSDSVSALEAISQAAQKPKAAAGITDIAAAAGILKLHVRIEPAPAMDRSTPVDVLLAVIENNLTSKVSRGENEGLTLSHAGVVRKADVIGRMDSRSGGFSADPVVRLPAQWKPRNLRVVLFAQSRKTKRIVAAASAPVLQ